MNMKKTSRVVIIIAALLILCIFNTSYAMGQWLQIVPKPKVASDFSLYDLEGNKVSLSDFKGERQLILFFWTTWCPHCLRQIESLNSLAEQLKDENVTILTINTGETPGEIGAFLKNRAVSSTILLDIGMDVARKYGVVGVPTFVKVALDGSIKFHENYLPKNIEKVLFDR